MDSKFLHLLEPISAELPCGEDLSFSPEFDRIQEARREDDPTADYGEWQISLKQADWDAVVAYCSELLQNRSKDLRLLAWLTEGWVKTFGLGGLADGMEASAALMERFGDRIHPRAEAGDQEQGIGSMSWFVIRMAQLTRQIAITDAGRFSLNDYDAAQLLHMQQQRNPDVPTDLEHKITLDKFSAAVTKTDKKLYAEWLSDAQRCRAALAELSKACDVLFGLDGPSLSTLAASIDAVLQRLQAIAKDAGISAFEDAATENNEEQPSSSMSLLIAETQRWEGTIKNRAQALELLRQVATFFRNTEPHSPVAYLADKAAHWGSMPLHSWLRSVVKDHGTLSHIEELLGLDMEAEGG